MRNFTKLLLMNMIICSCILIGCTTTGPKFTPISPIPEGKGLVYIYRSSSFIGCAVYGTVKANGTPIFKITNGGYYPYISDPGLVNISVTTEATNTATVDVKKGEEHYLKTTIGMGFFVGHLSFSEVSKDMGEREIKNCNLISSIKNMEK